MRCPVFFLLLLLREGRGDGDEREAEVSDLVKTLTLVLKSEKVLGTS